MLDVMLAFLLLKHTLMTANVAQRAATVICYLNTVAGGGATWFERGTGCPISMLEDLDQPGRWQAPCSDMSDRHGVRERQPHKLAHEPGLKRMSANVQRHPCPCACRHSTAAGSCDHVLVRPNASSGSS